MRKSSLFFFGESKHEPFHDALVEVFATKKGIPGGCEDFKDAIVDFEDGDIEGASSEIIDRNTLLVLFSKAVGKGRCGRLVDDAKDFESCHAPGVFCGLALGVVEIGGNGDDRMFDGSTDIILCDELEFGEEDTSDFPRGYRFGVRVGFGYRLVLREQVDRGRILGFGFVEGFPNGVR